MYCTKCGRENKDETRFCASCGAPVTKRSPAPDNPTRTTFLVTKGKNRASLVTMFSTCNAYKIAAGALCVVSIIAYVSVPISSFEQAAGRFSGLSTISAGLGSSVYFACILIPVSLMLIVILALVSASSKASDQIIRTAYFPIAGSMFASLVIVLGWTVFQGHGSNDTAIALGLTFGYFIAPAVVSAFACMLAASMIRLSNVKAGTGH